MLDMLRSDWHPCMLDRRAGFLACFQSFGVFLGIGVDSGELTSGLPSASTVWAQLRVPQPRHRSPDFGDQALRPHDCKSHGYRSAASRRTKGAEGLRGVTQYAILGRRSTW